MSKAKAQESQGSNETVLQKVPCGKIKTKVWKVHVQEASACQRCPMSVFPHWTKSQGGYGGGSHTTKKRRQERQRQQGLADILQNAIQQWQRTQSQRKLRAASPQEQNDSSLLDMVERMLKTCRQQQQDDFGLGRSGPNNSCFAQRKATELLPNNQQPKQRPEPS